MQISYIELHTAYCKSEERPDSGVNLRVITHQWYFVLWLWVRTARMLVSILNGSCIILNEWAMHLTEENHGSYNERG